MILHTWLHRALDLLWQLTLKPKKDFVVSLKVPPQKGTMMVNIPSSSLWQRETLSRKLVCVFAHSWEPSKTLLRKEGKAILMDEVFGGEDDLGDKLLELIIDHNETTWDFSSLSEDDLKRAHALEVHAEMALQRFSHITTDPPINLQLAKRNPHICYLVYPMVFKVPVISMRYFIQVHATFTFNEIRKSNHPRADDIISFLYELLFLQQKTAIALLEYAKSSSITAEKKTNNIMFVKAESDAIMGADLIVPYLKASVEKTLALVAATHLIDKLEEKKTHKAKMEALQKGLPDVVKKQFYCEFLLEFIKSENLESLNSYRSGLLHKKGIADLQPHTYVSVDSKSLPFIKIFAKLQEQHAKNSGVILAALALLTDELMRRSDQAFRDSAKERFKSFPNPYKTNNEDAPDQKSAR